MSVGKPQLQKTEINSININNYIKSWNTTCEKGSSSITKININVNRGISDVLSIGESLNNKSVVVSRGIDSNDETAVFKGNVLKNSIVGGELSIVCVDKLYEATKKYITYTFDRETDTEAGVYSEIFKTLINDYTDLVADDTSVVNSGTIQTIKKFRCENTTVFERLKKIADTIGWQFYYNPTTDKVHFEPVGTFSQSSVITQGNMVKVPKWQYDNSKIYNIVEVRGAKKEVGTVETGQIGVTSGYTTSGISLVHKPISTTVYIDSSNPPTTLLNGGIESSTSDYDYSVDDDKNLIEFDNDYTPSVNDYAKIEYSYYLPVPVIVEDYVSQSKYSVKKIVLEETDIASVRDAENYANEFLDKHKNPIVSSTIRVSNVSDFNVGQKVRVVDEDNSIDDYFYITKIKKSFPYRYDEVSVVNTLLSGNTYDWVIQTKIKRLEEQNAANDDLLVHAFPFFHYEGYDRYSVSSEKKNIVGSFVLGHSSYGVLGDSSLGSGGSSWIEQYEKVYWE